MCIDYNNLNKACPKDPFALPRINEVIDSVARCDALCLLDAYSRYHQINMKEGDEIKMSFITRFGILCYTSMLLDLKNTVATY